MKRSAVLVLLIATFVIIGSIIYVSFFADETIAPAIDSETAPVDTNKHSHDDRKTAQLRNGRYIDYTPANVAAVGYDETIVFFYAPWCPECRGFEKAIEASDIPRGVQILKTDYDSSKELRKKYGVTIQSTFVKVDSDGNKQSLWSGYGKDKSVDAILENT